MMRSYLTYVPVLEPELKKGSFRFTSGSSTQIFQLKEIIKMLLSKLQCCQAEVTKLRAAPRMQPQIKFVEKPVVQLVEKPAPPPQIITKIEYVEKPCPTLPPPPPITTPSPFLQVLDALPVPSNAFEKMKHDKMVAFLKRDDLGQVMSNLDLSAAADEQEKLDMILQKAVNLDFEQPTIDAIKYYINMAKSRGGLNLLARREYQKEFELTKIFIEVFDFASLSMEAKVAFDGFFNFLIGVTGEQMKNFVEWTEAKTKGEFMVVLFKYFVEQDFTPVEVKQHIELLKPFIRMDGPGATPP